MPPEGDPATEPATDPTPDPTPEPTPEPTAEPAPEPADDAVDPAILAAAQNPDAVQRAIAAERKTARDANARARELKAQLDLAAEAALPLEDRVKNAEQGEAAANLRALRIEVAAGAGLPLDFAGRLKGTTEEELKADAETFKAYLKPPAPTPPVDGGVRTTAPTPPGDPVRGHDTTLAAIIAANQGGGVIPGLGLEPAPED